MGLQVGVEACTRVLCKSKVPRVNAHLIYNTSDHSGSNSYRVYWAENTWARMDVINGMPVQDLMNIGCLMSIWYIMNS